MACGWCPAGPTDQATLKRVLTATVRGAGKAPRQSYQRALTHQGKPSLAGPPHSHPSWRPPAMAVLSVRVTAKVRAVDPQDRHGFGSSIRPGSGTGAPQLLHDTVVFGCCSGIWHLLGAGSYWGQRTVPAALPTGASGHPHLGR